MAFIAPAHAQLSQTHAGGVAGGGGPPPAFVGAGDIRSFTAWWSNSRAYSLATRGNPLINVCNSTGGTDVGCADMVTNATTGVLTPATISGISCPGANCTVRTYYDQTGGGNNCTQATIANRNVLTASQFGSIAGGVGTTSVTYSCTAIAQAPPWSMWSVSNQPSGGSGNYDTTIQQNGSNFYGLFTNQSLSQIRAGCGSPLAVSVTFPLKLAWAFVCPSAGNGTVWVNAAGTTGAAGNNALTTSGFTLQNWTGNAGTYAEGGVIGGDITSSVSSLTSNARSFYSF
jgi:hypothetical protein